MGGRKLKAWEIAAQNPVDINKNMNDFLEHIKNEPLGPGLAAIAAQLTEMYEANDNEARQFTHNLQKKFQKECDGYQTDTAKFIEDLAMGLQTRIKSLEKGKPIPEDWPQQMEDARNLSSLRSLIVSQKKQLTNFFFINSGTTSNFQLSNSSSSKRSKVLPDLSEPRTRRLKRIGKLCS